MDYEPAMDVSTALEAEEAAYFQSVIGIMRWMIEIGRIGIATEVSMLSSHLTYPREGHMEAALHVMAYLKGRPNTRLAMDPIFPHVDEDKFNTGAE